MLVTRVLAPTFALTTALWAAPPAPQQGLIHTLVSSYTQGEQLAMTLWVDPATSAEVRGFVARGATIDTVNITPTGLQRIGSTSMPDCQPLAMCSVLTTTLSPNRRELFIAGGALGLWRLLPCDELFASPTPTDCGTNDPSTKLLVQAPIQFSGGFERKRCVDVAVLKDHNPQLLFGLFSSLSTYPAGKRTEIRSYALWGTEPVQQAALELVPHQGGTRPEVGCALAVDDADNDSVYAAMGKGGIYRIDVDPQSGALSQTDIWHFDGTNPIPWCPHNVEHVRSLAVVNVTGSQPHKVLYAALNYNELLEIIDPGTPQAACSIQQMTFSWTDQQGQPQTSTGFPEKITALVDSNNRVSVAVALTESAGKHQDDQGPIDVNGIWSDPCIAPGTTDPDAPLAGSFKGSVQMWVHDFPSGQLQRVSATPRPGLNFLNYLQLRPLNATTHTLYMNSLVAGGEVFQWPIGGAALSAVGTPYKGQRFEGQDSFVSTVNNQVAMFVQEGPGAGELPNQAAVLSNVPPYNLTPLDKTASICENLPPSPAAQNCFVPQGGVMFGAQLMDTAHWVDPSNPNVEYSIVGRRLLTRFDYDNTPTNPTCTDNIPDCAGTQGLGPCDSAAYPYSTWHSVTTTSSTGWNLDRYTIPSPLAVPANGTQLNPQYWSIQDPVVPYDATHPAGENQALNGDYTNSIADPRVDPSTGLPVAVYVGRASTDYGVVAFRPKDLLAQCATSCGGQGRGDGELVAPPFQSVLTHLEFEYNSLTLSTAPYHSSCVPCGLCSFGYDATARRLSQFHADIYKTKDLGATDMWVLAIAGGQIAAYNDPGTGNPGHQPSSCLWNTHQDDHGHFLPGQATLVLVDVTATGAASFKQMSVVRIGLGDEDPTAQPGLAFGVRTKTYGRKTYAYVGDLLGRLLVYDVSGTAILPAAASPYLSVLGNSRDEKFLYPLAKIDLPVDPFDGYKPNIIDMEIVGDFLYCACGRGGIGIFDLLHSPGAPTLIDMMDTPGLALGLSTRQIAVTSGGNQTQLIEGDSRCGVRIYQ